MTRDDLIFALRDLDQDHLLVLEPTPTRYQIALRPVFADVPDGSQEFEVIHYIGDAPEKRETLPAILDVLRFFGAARSDGTGVFGANGIEGLIASTKEKQS